MVRVKHRYLLAQILYPEPVAKPSTTTVPASLEFRRPTPSSITSANIIRLIRDTIATFFGDHGAGLCASSLAVKYFSPSTSTLIIRCARDRARMVWSALTFITHLPKMIDGKFRGEAGTPCIFRVVKVSGTIRKSEEKVIELARKDIVRMKGIIGLEANDVLDGIVALGTTKGARSQEQLHAGDEDEDEDMSDLDD